MGPGPPGAPAADHSACPLCGGHVPVQEQPPVLICEASFHMGAAFGLPRSLSGARAGPRRAAGLRGAPRQRGWGPRGLGVFVSRSSEQQRLAPSSWPLAGRGGAAAIVSLPSRFVSSVRTVFLCKYGELMICAITQIFLFNSYFHISYI